ncbi:hypothetical protein SAMN04487907_103163 [Zunongwangia mangrovi]|uniref:Lysozyme inhibitor of I-type lysozyme n=1 Tax=Zunongwangia mangrovi TaxID=1334022 RepID=A0A1I1I1A8_9FLAO|nr:hypothetical protein [Zunongwangia mangrovi]SFC27010.1 hypothetical protein SAMN04487907_103163 [Zunongwangia mangrovi]
MYFRFFILVFSLFLCLSCKNNDPNKEHLIDLHQKNIIPDGTYVADRYEDRNDGYDWVGVEITSITDTIIKVSIRSRADLKRPTCTLHCLAIKIDDSIYQSIKTTLPVQFKFNKSTLSIFSKSPQDLAYFCSGGASIEGSYRMIERNLDAAQVDPRVYSKYLHSERVNFEINVTSKNEAKVLKVIPMGLSKDNSIYTQSLDMEIVNTQITDLDQDGAPELIIQLQNFETHKSDLIVFTTNHKKSMSLVNFPVNEFNLKNGAYKGYDTYEIEKGRLKRSFPIFQDGKQTNNKHLIIYKLIPGEAMPQLKVDLEQTM